MANRQINRDSDRKWQKETGDAHVLSNDSPPRCKHPDEAYQVVTGHRRCGCECKGVCNEDGWRKRATALKGIRRDITEEGERMDETLDRVTDQHLRHPRQVGGVHDGSIS